MDQLSIREKKGANYVLLELNGACNAYTITEFREKVYANMPNTNVVLDMSGVTQVDSSGMGIILAGFNDGLKYKTKLFIMNPSDKARYALEKTGFYDTFFIIHSVTEVSDA